MALTMTRTRTQTTLTKLVELVANVHGELAFVDGLLASREDGLQGVVVAPGAGTGMNAEVRERLVVRRRTLLANCVALYVTVRQFDPEIDPGRIGVAEGWRKRFGRLSVRPSMLIQRYMRSLL